MSFIDFHTHHPAAEGVISPRSFGLHPWDADTVLFDDGLFAPDLQLIGECGLDRCCPAAWERQLALFEAQLTLAERRGLPVVVHCVRAYDTLLALRKRFGATPWMVHGFAGSAQQAEQLWRLGIGISLGAALLDDRREKVRETLRQRYGKQRLFLETDMAPVTIQEVYRTAAEILKVDMAEMEAKLHESLRELIK